MMAISLLRRSRFVARLCRTSSQFFGMFRGRELGVINEAVTFVLFIAPLLVSGIALVGMRRPEAIESTGESVPIA